MGFWFLALLLFLVQRTEHRRTEPSAISTVKTRPKTAGFPGLFLVALASRALLLFRLPVFCLYFLSASIQLAFFIRYRVTGSELLRVFSFLLKVCSSFSFFAIQIPEVFTTRSKLKKIRTDFAKPSNEMSDYLRSFDEYEKQLATISPENQ